MRYVKYTRINAEQKKILDHSFKKRNMMDHQQEMEQRLWEYIDGICTAQERNTIAGLLKKDSVWHIKYERTGCAFLKIYKKCDGRNCPAPGCTGNQELYK